MAHASLTAVALVLVGLVLGMRHALEPDHLAAVSTLLDGGRRRFSAAAFLGAFWGLGHTLAILGFGGVLLWMRIRLPGRAQACLEVAVAAMLAGLGARGLYRAHGLSRSPGNEHRHQGVFHSHGGEGRHVHVGPFAVGFRPLLVGLLHGLAGTGALTSLVLATMPTMTLAIAYLVSFGFGSLLGMTTLTFGAGVALQRMESVAARALLGTVTSLFSLAYGLYWGSQQLSLLR